MCAAEPGGCSGASHACPPHAPAPPPAIPAAFMGHRPEEIMSQSQRSCLHLLPSVGARACAWRRLSSAREGCTTGLCWAAGGSTQPASCPSFNVPWGCCCTAINIVVYRSFHRSWPVRRAKHCIYVSGVWLPDVCGAFLFETHVHVRPQRRKAHAKYGQLVTCTSYMNSGLSQH